MDKTAGQRSRSSEGSQGLDQMRPVRPWQAHQFPSEEEGEPLQGFEKNDLL